MHGGETAPRFNAPPSLCWSLRGVGPHPGGSHPQHPPALCMCCCCCFGCFGPRHRAAANQGGGKRRVQRGSWTPRTASAVAQAGGQGLLFHLRAAIGIHTQIPFPCMGIRAARSPVFCPCCAWGAMVSPAEPSCNVEHKRSALHRWLGLGLLPTPPLQTVPKLALVLSRSSRGQDAQNAHSCSQCPTLRCLGFWSQRCSGFPYERHSEQTAKSRTDLCLEDAKDLAFVCH